MNHDLLNDEALSIVSGGKPAGTAAAPVVAPAAAAATAPVGATASAGCVT